MSDRPSIIVGNWKMHKTVEESVAFVEQLKLQVGGAASELLLAVPYTAIAPAVAVASDIVIGAQNMNDATEGAFTGEIAAHMLIEAGARFVILGHSERRHIFGETSAFINKKVKRALSDGLRPLLCIGETLNEREAGETQQRLKEQLLSSLEGLETLGSLILAYEPVWAIGTGKTATPEQANEAHHFCRQVVEEKWGGAAASNIPLLYGGSVKPRNAHLLMAQPDVDGLLVGGASLSYGDFEKIINYNKGAITG